MHSKFLRVGRVGSGTREPEKGVSAQILMFCLFEGTCSKNDTITAGFLVLFCFLLATSCDEGSYFPNQYPLLWECSAEPLDHQGSL